MKSPITCSSVITRAADAPSALGRRMKRSILFGMRMSAFIALPSLARARWSAMVKPRLGMNGNGCAGSMASGVSKGKICRRKWSSSQVFSFFVTSGPSTSTMPCSASIWRSSCQRADGLSDAGKLFRRGEPVRALDRNAGALLALEAGNADHEEFVEVVGGNRQKPNTLEQGMGVVCRLLEHAAVELEPRQLAIDEPFRARD